MPFGFLVARAIGSTGSVVSGKTLWILVVLATLLYGMSDEYHQSFVPGSDFEFFDIVVDTIGGAIGGAVYLLYVCKSKKN